MGEAFKSEKQVVLLIDEIDKADLEFPNDLLWELDKMEFYINETKETVKAKHRPIVIITSNAEKELPDAFLRRCIFHYIEFPLAPKMREIVNVHYKDLDKHLLDQAMEAFYWIRSMNEIQKSRAHRSFWTGFRRSFWEVSIRIRLQSSFRLSERCSKRIRISIHLSHIREEEAASDRASAMRKRRKSCL